MADGVNRIGAAGTDYGDAEVTEVADNIFDELKSALSTKVEAEPLPLKVPGRPQFVVTFMPVIELDDYKAWVKTSTSKSGPTKGDVDQMKLAMIVLSRTMKSFTFKGHLATDKETGEPLHFTSHKFHEMLGAPIGGVNAAIRRMYGRDGDIINVMNRIIAAAGYDVDEDLEATDDPLGS
jgi:hypothetical protein